MEGQIRNPTCLELSDSCDEVGRNKRSALRRMKRSGIVNLHIQAYFHRLLPNLPDKYPFQPVDEKWNTAIRSPV